MTECRLATVTPHSRPDPNATVHVRLVTWDDEPPVGGQGIYARELRAALSERGVCVTTVAGRGSKGVPYRRVTGRGHLDMSIRLNAHPSILLDDGPDLVHVSGGPGGLQLVRRLPVPVVFTAHHTYRQAHGSLSPHGVLSSLEARGYRRAAAVAAVSEDTRRAVCELGVPQERVQVISPGVRSTYVGAPVARVPGAMLFVGRLEREKGPLDALDAMQRVLRELPTARGTIVGAGSLGGLVRARTSVDDRLTVRSHISDDELAIEYRRAQIVLMPSQFEGLGLVALEAMAAGAVVVGYDVLGLRETIGGNGTIVPTGDVSELAAVCLHLLQNESLREEIADRAATAVGERYSWKRCAAEFEELYRRVLGRS